MCIGAGLLLLQGILPSCQQPNNNSRPTVSVADTLTQVAKVKTPPDTTTLDGIWFLQPVLASDTATGKTPTLVIELNKKRFSGNTGCNTMGGAFWYSAQDSSLSFNDKLIMSRMACPGYNEKAFLNSLQHTSHFRLKNGTLSLLGDDNTELSHWARTKATALKTEKT
jgi:heat shock protein HslJ